MTTGGWIFIILSWGIVLSVLVWCIHRVLTSKKHWIHPEEDIQELHHGEFEPPR